jgi:hypothetical protein
MSEIIVPMTSPLNRGLHVLFHLVFIFPHFNIRLRRALRRLQSTPGNLLPAGRSTQGIKFSVLRLAIDRDRKCDMKKPVVRMRTAIRQWLLSEPALLSHIVGEGKPRSALFPQ